MGVDDSNWGPGAGENDVDPTVDTMTLVIFRRSNGYGNKYCKYQCLGGTHCRHLTVQTGYERHSAPEIEGRVEMKYATREVQSGNKLRTVSRVSRRENLGGCESCEVVP